MSALLYWRTPPNLSRTVSIAIVMDICVNVVRNQASQCTELFSPIIRITCNYNYITVCPLIYIYTVFQKNVTLFTFTITSSDVGRFS